MDFDLDLDDDGIDVHGGLHPYDAPTRIEEDDPNFPLFGGRARPPQQQNLQQHFMFSNQSPEFDNQANRTGRHEEQKTVDNFKQF